MLVFDIDKEKTITMMIEATGIDNIDSLDVTFNVTVNKIKYGFPCDIKEGKITIKVPALRDVIKGIKTGEYKASLEVLGDKNYYLQPFNEEVTLKQDPKLNVIVDEKPLEENDIKEISASISKIISEDEEVIEKEEVSIDSDIKEPKTKKSSSLDSIFDK